MEWTRGSANGGGGGVTGNGGGEIVTAVGGTEITARILTMPAPSKIPFILFIIETMYYEYQNYKLFLWNKIEQVKQR